MAKREIFNIPLAAGGRGGYAMCEIIYDDDEYMIAVDPKGGEHVCRPAYNHWMAMDPMDIITELKSLRARAA
jgi:hypothetical protein